MAGFHDKTHKQLGIQRPLLTIERLYFSSSWLPATERIIAQTVQIFMGSQQWSKWSYVNRSAAALADVERTITDIRDSTKTLKEIPPVDATGGLGLVGAGLSHESAKREQVPPHFLARLLAPLTPLFVLMRGLRPTSVKHTHTLTPSSRSPMVLFVSTYRWNRLSIQASSHVWRSFWENHTPENHGPDPLTVQLWFVCVCVRVCHSPSSHAHPRLRLIHPSHLRVGQHMSESGRKWGWGLVASENENDGVVYYAQAP